MIAYTIMKCESVPMPSKPYPLLRESGVYEEFTMWGTVFGISPLMPEE